LTLNTITTAKNKTVYDFDNTLALDTFISRIFLNIAIWFAQNNANIFAMINVWRTRFMKPNKNIQVEENISILTSRMPQDKKAVIGFMAKHYPNTAVKIQTRTTLQESEESYKYSYLQANNVTFFYENNMDVIKFLINKGLVNETKVLQGETW